MFFPFNGSLSSRFFWLAVSILAVFVASGYMWKRFQNEFAARPEYQVRSEAVMITQPPGFLRVDVKSEVLDKLSSEKISLLDQDLCQKMGEAFLNHRSVSGVYSVTKSLTAIECQIDYHQPAVLLELASNESKLVPITADGVAMHEGDIDPAFQSELIRIRVDDFKSDEILDQKPIQQAEVKGCIAIAQQIQTVDELPSGLAKISAVNQFGHPTYQLEMKNGVRVIWGAGPEEQETNQASTQEKLTALREVVKNYAGNQPGFLNLDIRSGKVRRVIPKTAAR